MHMELNSEFPSIPTLRHLYVHNRGANGFPDKGKCDFRLLCRVNRRKIDEFVIYENLSRQILHRDVYTMLIYWTIHSNTHEHVLFENQTKQKKKKTKQVGQLDYFNILVQIDFFVEQREKSLESNLALDQIDLLHL